MFRLDSNLDTTLYPPNLSSSSSSSTSSSKTSSSRTDSHHPFIVLKAVDTRPLYVGNGHDSLSATSWSDDLNISSVLAFGGQKRQRKSKSSGSSTRSVSPAFSSSSRDPSISEPFPLWSGRASLVDVPTATPLLVNVEVHPEQYSEAEKEASWRAFRAKYQRAEYLESEKLGGFDCRYGPGRGFARYRHRKGCDVSCEGACFGR